MEKNFTKNGKIFPPSYPLTISKGILLKEEILKKEILNEKEKVEKEKNFDWEIFLKMFPINWQEDPDFSNAIKLFTNHRRELHRPLTKQSRTIIVNKFAKFPIENCTESLHVAMERGYIAPFPKDQLQKDFTKPAKVKSKTKARDPEDVIHDHIKSSYASRFMDYYYNAENILEKDDPEDREQLACNMLTLRDQIKSVQKQKALSNHQVPSPGGIIDDFTDWLEEQTWIKSIQPQLYDFNGKIFQKFFNQYSFELGVDVMQGEAV